MRGRCLPRFCRNPCVPVSSVAKHNALLKGYLGDMPIRAAIPRCATFPLPPDGEPVCFSNRAWRITMAEGSEGMRDRLTRQSEDALGKLAQDLLENPVVSGAITRAFGARERAVQAQEAAMGALNIPSAADLERLTRRLRSVSQRLEGIEDAVDRLDGRMEALGRSADGDLSARLGGVEPQLATLSAEIGQLSAALDARPAPVPREQERLA